MWHHEKAHCIVFLIAQLPDLLTAASMCSMLTLTLALDGWRVDRVRQKRKSCMRGTAPSTENRSETLGSNCPVLTWPLGSGM